MEVSEITLASIPSVMLTLESGALAYALWEVLNRQKGQPSTEQAQLLPQQFTGIGSGQDDLQSGPLTGATLGVFHGVADLSLIEQRQQIQRQIELLRDREKKADETARTLWLATEEALPANTEASLQRRIGYVNDQEKKLREDELRINHREQQLLQDEKRLSQLQSTLKDHPSRTASGQPLDPGMPTILDQLRFLEQRELDVGRQEVALREERAMLQKLAKEEGIKAEQFRAKYQNGGTKCPHPGCSAKAGSTIEVTYDSFPNSFQWCVLTQRRTMPKESFDICRGARKKGVMRH